MKIVTPIRNKQPDDFTTIFKAEDCHNRFIVYTQCVLNNKRIYVHDFKYGKSAVERKEKMCGNTSKTRSQCIEFRSKSLNCYTQRKALIFESVFRNLIKAFNSFDTCR